MRATIGNLILWFWPAAAALAGVPTQPAAAASVAAHLEKAAPAVVTLYAMDRRYERRLGAAAGFFIREDGVVVTARHVAEYSDALVAVTADGKEHRVTGFYGEDRDYDVAVVKVDGSGYAHLSLAAPALPQTNQWVAVLSPETNGQLYCVSGVVQEVAGLPNIIEIIWLKLALHPGQSGSPVVNELGEVLGVASGTRSDGTGFAMPADIVQRLLAHSGQAGPTPFAKRPRKGTSTHAIADETFRAAVRAMAREDWSAAEPLVKRAAKKFPDSAFTQTLLGIAEFRRRDLKRADAAFAKVVRLKPESSFAWLMYGCTSLLLQRFTDADAALRRSIELGLTAKDQLEQAWQTLACVRAVRNDAQGARDALATLRRLDPAKADTCRRELQRDFPKLVLTPD